MNPAISHSRALVASFVAAGIEHACVAPGSRSAPVAIALAESSNIRLHVGTDERSMAFMALGIAKVSGRPAVVLTTSGSAAANLHPAVVEADLSEVPLILITADRPPELQGVKAPQTMDQSHLFGSAVRWFYDPGVPHLSDPSGRRWAWLGSRAYQMATSERGPVHLNLAFREPLHPDHDEPSPERAEASELSAHLTHTDRDLQLLKSLADQERGLIVVGTSRIDPSSIRLLSQTTGWPLIAEAASRARIPGCITMYDLLLREPLFTQRITPDVVIRIGDPGISKSLMTYLDSASRQIAITPSSTVADPHRSVDTHIRCEVEPLLLALSRSTGPAPSSRWAETWQAAEQRARAAVDEVLDSTDFVNEPRAARDLYDSLPAESHLLAASSMPIRELDWFMRARDDVDVLANRGVNGIDGFTSTLAGITADRGEAFGICGDLAFLHDLSGLAMASQMSLPLRMLVLNNDGGGIFSFLPYTGLETERFEQLFGTPHGHDLSAIATSLKVATEVLEDPVSLPSHISSMRNEPGPTMLELKCDRQRNLELHQMIWEVGRRAVVELLT